MKQLTANAKGETVIIEVPTPLFTPEPKQTTLDINKLTAILKAKGVINNASDVTKEV